MAHGAEAFAKSQLEPMLVAHGFVRRERAYVRLARTRAVAVVVTASGSRWNVARSFSEKLGVPNHVIVKIELFAGVDVPASPKKMLLAFPRAVDSTVAAVCAWDWERQYRERDDNLKSDASERVAELVALESLDDVLAHCKDREGAKPFMLATLLAGIRRVDQARELFRHPSCGDAALVAQHAARIGIEIR